MRDCRKPGKIYFKMSPLQQPTTLLVFYIHFGLLMKLNIYTYTLCEASMLSGHLYVQVTE